MSNNYWYVYIYTMQLYKIISIMLIDTGCHEILTRKNKVPKWYIVWIDKPHSFHFEPSWLKVQRSNRIIVIWLQRQEWCGMHILNVKKKKFQALICIYPNCQYLPTIWCLLTHSR